MSIYLLDVLSTAFITMISDKETNSVFTVIARRIKDFYRQR